MSRVRFAPGALLLAAWLLPVRAHAAELGAAEASGKPGAQASAAAADPMEQLRERLAARLAGAAAPPGGRPGELRLLVRPNAASEPAAHAPLARAAVPRHVAGFRAPAREHGGDNTLHWGYDGAAGPQAWGALKPEFAQCAGGQRQSPIDIRDGLAVDLEPVHFNYQPGHFSVLDNGHTLQVNVAPGDSIEVAGRRYELVQFHFHRPSEERIAGRRFAMSLHLVHRDDEGRLAVVTLLVDQGEPQPVVQQVWNNLPLERGETQPTREMLDPAKLLPADRRYYTYMGSLTTPPCTEGVRWIVMRQPVTLSAAQIDLFARIYPMNARPLQSADGRRILQSE